MFMAWNALALLKSQLQQKNLTNFNDIVLNLHQHNRCISITVNAVLDQENAIEH